MNPGWIVALLVGLASNQNLVAAPLDGKHLGVASCASSTCHGRIAPDEDAQAALNEYFVWSKYDAHSAAYRVLEDDWARRIAANLGLGDPVTERQCLVCHADWVPEPQRGERFQLSDGVGCEACHGGAENWIAFHYGDDASHAENLERGMWPTDEAAFLAGRCLACHMGDAERLATHEMMAAGHPRLQFEMDTWLANMPPHHVEDADYRRRKGIIGHVDRWAAGVAATARGYLRMLPAYIQERALVPEPALFDCQACHRPMDTEVVRSTREKDLLPAGTVRPDDHALQMLAIVVAIRDAGLADAIRRGTRVLHGAAAGSRDAFLDGASRLLVLVERAARVISRNSLARPDRLRLRRTLLQAAARGIFRDYADATQLFLALQTLAAQADMGPSRYDELFRLLDNPRDFAPERVAAEARRLLKLE